MMVSKVGSVAFAPGRAFSTRRMTSLSCGFGLGGTLPLPSMRLGVSSPEAEPSETTSATRYDLIEGVGVAPMIMPELELVDVERHVGIRHFVERADNAAFEQRPEAFDVLSVNRTDDVLALNVVNGLVRIGGAEAAIADPLIGREQANLLGDDLAHEAFECRAVYTFDNAGNDAPAALYSADDRRFARTHTASAAALEPLANMPVLRETSDEGFIDLDLAEQLALGAVLHRDADAVAHVPSGFIAARPEHPVDLIRTHALFRVVHEERDFEPLAQRVLGVLEDGFGDDGEPIAILVAGFAEPMEGAGLDFPYLHVAAARAGNASRPTALNEERLAIIFGLEPSEEFVEFHKAEYSHSGSWCQVPDNRPILISKKLTRPSLPAPTSHRTGR